MANIIAVEIEGLNELLATCKDTDRLLGGPMKRFFTASAIAVQNRSKKAAPVDRGLLHNSINYEVDSDRLPTWASIGPNVAYGASVEYGIGDFNEGPGGLGQAPLPTEADLEGWAQRHGLSAHAVAKAIERRGGIPPNPYMRTGLTESTNDIAGYLNQAGKDIEEIWRG